MLIFKKEKRRNVLKGRTIKYLTSTGKIECSSVHLSNILNAKTPCSSLLAKNIIECVSPDARIEDYFVKLEK